MLPVRLPPFAVGLVATASLAWSLACGGGDGEPPTPTPSPAATISPTSIPMTEPVTGASLDLSQQPPLLTISGADIGDQAANTPRVASGDFNGDGLTDLLIGISLADGPDGSRPDSGEVYVVFGGSLAGDFNLAEDPVDMVIYGAAVADSLGFSVLGADINGDGVDDVIVGAPGVTAGEDPRTDQGRVYVLFGGEELKGTFDLADDPQDFVVTGAEGFSRIGHAIASGDVNGDGRDDLVLGAPFAGRELGSPPGSPRTHVGEAYVVFGGPNLSGEVSIPSLEQDVTFSGAQEFGQFGASVASADVNGDGTDDIIVGAHRSGPDAARAAGGAAYVFLGRRDLGGRITIEDNGQDATILGGATGNSFGFPLTTGDFNGDGIHDIASGAQLESRDMMFGGGAVHLFFGGPSLSGTIDLAETSSDVTLLATFDTELLPSALAAADLNGDGLDDLIAGSPLASAPQGRTGAGRVYILLGSPDLQGVIDLSQGQQSLTILGIGRDDRLGGALAAADLTGDGAVELLIATAFSSGTGAPRADTGQVYAVRPNLE